MEEIYRLNNAVAESSSLYRDSKEKNKAFVTSKALTTAGEVELRKIERERCGSLGTMNFEIRKIRGELSKSDERIESQTNTTTDQGMEENIPTIKIRISTKEAATRERERFQNLLRNSVKEFRITEQESYQYRVTKEDLMPHENTE